MVIGLLFTILLSKVPFGLIFKISVMSFLIGGMVFFFLGTIYLLKTQVVWKRVLSIPAMMFFFCIQFGFGGPDD